jgi:hypothetical protein
MVVAGADLMSDNDLALRNFVRIEAPKGLASLTKITIGNTIIPVYSAEIKIRVGEETRVILEAPAYLIDVEALEKNTELKIVKEATDAEGEP